MSQPNDIIKQPPKWPQFIGPIVILLIAVGAAIFGVLWTSDNATVTPTDETSTAQDQSALTPPDITQDLADVQQEFPEAPVPHQEALATARTETATYIMSEAMLDELLTLPQHGYDFADDASEFAVEHVGVDWNDHAHQFLLYAQEQVPQAQPAELRQLLQDDPQGPRFTAEQTDYALAQEAMK